MTATATAQGRRVDGRFDYTVDFEALGQLSFDIVPLVQVENARALTLQQRFEEFHRLNPWVYDALVKLTADWVGKGQSRVGMKMLFEVIRWHYGRATRGDSEWRLNNNLTSRYARLLVDEHPEYAGAFELRALRTN